jgi:serine/threonine protein kinase
MCVRIFPFNVACRLQNHYVLNHPHVIKLKDVFVAGDFLNIVLELAPDGMLHEYVNGILTANGVMQEGNAR